jgi:hypothetical protein
MVKGGAKIAKVDRPAVDAKALERAIVPAISERLRTAADGLRASTAEAGEAARAEAEQRDAALNARLDTLSQELVAPIVNAINESVLTLSAAIERAMVVQKFDIDGLKTSVAAASDHDALLARLDRISEALAVPDKPQPVVWHFKMVRNAAGDIESVVATPEEQA